MTITIEVPDSIAKGLRLPEHEAKERLQQELAVSLYAQGILSFGRSSELAGVGRFLFGDLLTRRNIPRHYTSEELSDDIAFANS